MAKNQEPLMRSALEKMLKEFKEGKPELVLFTTFNFSASFFEANILPLMAGNSVEEIKGNSEARAELNAALEQVRTLVICDRSARPEPKGDFRYGLMPVGLEKGRFHPKIILMSGILADTGNRGLWLSVGSGNLSLSGWAVNREIVGTTPVAAKHLPELQALLGWLLGEAERRIDWIVTAEPPTLGSDPSVLEEGGSRNILKALIESSNQYCIPDEEAADLPSLHLSLPLSAESMGPPPKMTLLSELTGGRSWKRATVVSPFWADVPTLVKELQVEHCRFVPSLRPDGKYSFPFGTLPEETNGNNRHSFLKFREDSDRYTHAKAILLEDGEERVLCAGSANFTTAALMNGSGVLSNVEAVLRYSIAKGDPWGTLFAGLADDQVSDDHLDEGSPQLPPFDAEVVCDWRQKKFFCRFRVHKGESIKTASLEVGGHLTLLETTPEKEKRCECLFKGPLPVRNFFVIYSWASGESIRYQGLVTQLNAADDDLGYRPRPRLSKVLELLRSLDPEQSESGVRCKAGQTGDADDDDDGSFEPSFDFFSYFQATYKMRNYYAHHPELDPFLESAPQGIPVLFRAVALQPTENAPSQIERYVQLAELLETLEEFKQHRGDSQESDQGGAILHLQNSIEEEICKLEPVISALMADSSTFKGIFGHGGGTSKKVQDFLDWFRQELKEQPHA